MQVIGSRAQVSPFFADKLFLSKRTIAPSFFYAPVVNQDGWFHQVRRNQGMKYLHTRKWVCLTFKSIPHKQSCHRFFLDYMTKNNQVHFGLPKLTEKIHKVPVHNPWAMVQFFVSRDEAINYFTSTLRLLRSPIVCNTCKKGIKRQFLVRRAGKETSTSQCETIHLEATASN